MKLENFQAGGKLPTKNRDVNFVHENPYTKFRRKFCTDQPVHKLNTDGTYRIVPASNTDQAVKV